MARGVMVRMEEKERSAKVSSSGMPGRREREEEGKGVSE